VFTKGGGLVYFNEFIQEVMDILPEYLLSYDVEEIKTQKVVKNNGVSLVGLMILLKGETVAPNIYMDYYYTLFNQGTSLDEIVSEIVSEYEESRGKLPACASVEFNPEKMKDNVYMVLVNYDKNKEKLNECPYLPFLDMAIMFRYVVSEEDNCVASGLVRRFEQELWNMSTEELYSKAVENTKTRFPMCVAKLTDTMKKLQPEEKFVPECNLYVMTNSINANGSIYMTDKTALEDFAESQSSNFYIIPSSIHEVLLFPDDKSLSREQLLDVLADVNRYVLSDMEFLSDKVYYYDRSTKTLTY
jgi:hypothetical protein